MLYPKLIGAAAGGLAGLIGLSVLEINCSNLDVFHILVWHWGVVLISSGGRAARRGRRIRRRAEPEGFLELAALPGRNFLLESGDYELLYFFNIVIRHQRAVRVRISGDQQRHFFFHLPAIKQNHSLIRGS
jgi:hypothetical protein